jgi:hypothetical protein
VNENFFSAIGRNDKTETGLGIKPPVEREKREEKDGKE